MNTSFFGELLQTISERGRALVERTRERRGSAQCGGDPEDEKPSPRLGLRSVRLCIGKLLGFETRTVAGVTRDYLLLAFRGDDRLYVPHEQIGKVSKYIGADAGAPALSKLGGKAWQNLKSRARTSLRELAGELLALYARRQQAPGVAYELENEWLERLEAEFPYRETEDQRRAIEAVKEDLEAPRPNAPCRRSVEPSGGGGG